MKCKICREDYPEDLLEEGICQACMASIVLNKNISPTED